MSPECASSVNRLRKEMQDLETEVGHMVAINEGLKKEKSHAEDEYRQQGEGLSRDLAAAKMEISRLRESLERYNDYDEVKRELEILKVGTMGSSETNILCLTLRFLVCGIWQRRCRYGCPTSRATAKP